MGGHGPQLAAPTLTAENVTHEAGGSLQRALETQQTPALLRQCRRRRTPTRQTLTTNWPTFQQFQQRFQRFNYIKPWLSFIGYN